jgi:hypothetical protein
MLRTTLSQKVYDKKRDLAINSQFIRKELTLSEFQVVDNEHIKIDDIMIEVTPKAFNRLLARFRVPAAFAKRFAEGFGDDGLRQLLNTMKNLKSAKNEQKVTLIVNPDTRKIVDILPKGYASISTETFFEFVEDYIGKYDFEVKSLGHDTYGGTHLHCIQPNCMMEVPGLENEKFLNGVMFRNSPQRGLEVSPYVDRVICENGMTSKLFAENYQLHNLSDKNIKEFNERMLQMAATNFRPAGMVENIKKASEIDASIAEIEAAANAMLYSAPEVEFGYIEKYLPIAKVNKAYAMVGADVEEFTFAQKKNAKSGISVWDVVNGITNFASNDSRYAIDDWKRGRLMESAGNLLFKKNFDTESLLNVDPFSGGRLLTTEEAAKLRGDLK